MAAEIADDIFPLDFHIYEVKCPENCMMQIGVETVWQVIDGSFSGDKKTMALMGNYIPPCFIISPNGFRLRMVAGFPAPLRNLINQYGIDSAIRDTDRSLICLVAL